MKKESEVAWRSRVLGSRELLLYASGFLQEGFCLGLPACCLHPLPHGDGMSFLMGEPRTETLLLVGSHPACKAACWSPLQPI